VVIFAVSVIFSGSYEDLIIDQLINDNIFLLLPLTIFIEAVPQWVIPHAMMVLLFSLGANAWFVFLYVAIGSLIGSVASFEVGSRYGQRLTVSLVKDKKMENIEYWIDRYGNWFIFLAAFLPLPFIPLFFGAIGYSRRDFLLYGLFVREMSFLILTIAFVYF